VLLLVSGLALAEDEVSVSRQSFVLRPSPIQTADGKPEKLEFTAPGQPPDTKGWIRHQGGWQLETVVQHSGLLCGTYQVGVRFGIGNPGCTDVQWLSEPQFVTRQKQCNGAAQAHTAGDISSEYTRDFARLTCVERVIKCTGNCK
jgi:hypothetical protein